ncbi:hypothetical protein Clacol_002401 [Clathrus columnatus]|uniref:PhoD-like phosphatase domain-containing protein n=1 Tax=Clathrus columnatus TaxID=1419009 RepID=A0AAV5A407_9AGAM|nr:hypothetical protein Clacol_002401 [Clathrus columnatus]
MSTLSTLTCGPLLRYRLIDYDTATWNGSLLIVTPTGIIPSYLKLTQSTELTSAHVVVPLCIFSGEGHSFWRYPLSIRLSDEERKIKYELDEPEANGSFWIPGKDQTMRTMFYSCNGFSVKVPHDAFAGPVLWKDSLSGGGDQIYSDRVAVTGPLQSWSKETSPKRRAETPFTEQMSKDLDDWYFWNYIDWYTTSPYREALASIPGINIWDDHDIIDGYGSYKDRFMRTPIFLGIGKIAYKYYMLFQHHTNPDDKDTTATPDPSFVVGNEPGPYIQYKSISLSTNLGPRTVFYGLECRVERTRERICYESTYDQMFLRLEDTVKKGITKHLVILVGVPIAYPRLVWLEGLLSSRFFTGPLSLFNKIFGVGKGLFNKFDGSSELLDDLDDHWCAVHHKRERNAFVRRLQSFAEHKAVRITILSGDVHLASVGRFYSSPRLDIPQNKDHRYMVNIISSAITNAPPPTAVANLMHRRNKIHILDRHTHENLMALFRETPEGKKRTKCATMPARNYVIITEHAGLMNQSESQENGPSEISQQNLPNETGAQENGESADLPVAKSERGGVTAKENVSAAAPAMGTTRLYALDVAFKVEINPKDSEGRTKSYGFSIPALEV